MAGLLAESKGFFLVLSLLARADRLDSCLGAVAGGVRVVVEVVGEVFSGEVGVVVVVVVGVFSS